MARPKKLKHEKFSEKVATYVTESIYEKMEREIAERQSTESAILREALVEYLAKRKPHPPVPED